MGRVRNVRRDTRDKVRFGEEEGWHVTPYHVTGLFRRVSREQVSRSPLLPVLDASCHAAASACHHA